VVTLIFPSARAMGTVAWPVPGAAPVLARGVVTVPDGAEVTLDVKVGSQESEVREDPDKGCEITAGSRAADLGFLRQLPADGITNLHLRAPIVPESLAALTHLAPGLRRLYLGWADLSDDALAHVSKLTGLIYLQTWGNRFTDRGVQQLAALTRLESLYLEEETLSAAAFDFTVSLPHLSRLGVQDVPLTQAELTELRRRLPSVGIH
jgi:hypothetical protein